MRVEREAALKLRLKGKSYTEIFKELGIPKSTLSGWLRDVVISQHLQAGIAKRAYKKSLVGLLRHNKNQTLLAIKRAASIRKSARNEIQTLSPRDVCILGIALYWAEGYKRPVVRNGREVTHHAVSLTNSDPSLVNAFLRFLREFCGTPNEKIKADLRIFPHQNELELLKFWQKTTGILRENFRKTYSGISKASSGIRPYNRLPYGVIQIIVADTALFHKIMGYIEKIKQLV